MFAKKRYIYRIVHVHAIIDLLIITPPPQWKHLCDALVLYYCVSKY